MHNYSIAEIMEMAVQTERLGQEFYTVMGSTFQKNRELHDLFKTLADKERIHAQTFAELKTMVSKTGPEPVQWEDVSDYLRSFVESEFFLGKGKALPSMDRITTVAEAVRFALGFEKETLLYYMELRTIVKEKAVVDEVIQEEKKHILWLERLKNSLAKGK
jgi:rubrerythrin